MSIKKKQRYVLSLIGVMMLTTLSVTGCGGSVNVNSNKTGEISEVPESGSEDEQKTDLKMRHRIPRSLRIRKHIPCILTVRQQEVRDIFR